MSFLCCLTNLGKVLRGFQHPPGSNKIKQHQSFCREMSVEIENTHPHPKKNRQQDTLHIKFIGWFKAYVAYSTH